MGGKEDERHAVISLWFEALHGVNLGENIALGFTYYTITSSPQQID